MRSEGFKTGGYVDPTNGKTRQFKPGYTLTRQIMWPSFVLSWVIIVAIVGGGLMGISQAVELAPTTLPSMVALIAGLLGIHRWTGSRDFQAIQERGEGE